MGHKKKTAAPRPRQPLATEAPVDVAEAEPIESSAAVESDGGSSCASIKLECERALTAIRRGNHTRALRLMKESCSRHESSPHSALVHRVQGTVCTKVASIIDDPNAKQRHLKNAIESAKKAVDLSPNSIEFAFFYANMLYEAANDAKDYEEVVQECESALAIENPIDPAEQNLQGENQQRTSTAEVRIAQVQGELRSLIQKSNIASISTWMKNLGTGEEKFRLIPIRRVAEDPMEVRVLSTTRRPNEIKKATKTPEERRKEIEVRVAAARLLQQKSEVSSPQLQSEGERNGGAGDSVSGSGQRGERRRRKNGSTAERKDWVHSFWNSMTVDAKRDLLRIKVCDLKAHFVSSKDGLASEVLLEALEFGKANKTWKFWVCCRCKEKFADSESHMQHVVQEHMGSLLPKMQAVLPQSIDNEWIEMLVNYSWKPLDISAAVKMLDCQSKFLHSELAEDFYSGNPNGECEDCFKDAWDSSPLKGELGGYSCDNSNENDCGKAPSIECKECDPNQASVSYPLVDNWPIADDTEREKVLERIHAAFEQLIRHKCLAVSHLNKVMQFTMDELQSLASGSKLLNHGIDQTPISICFLGATQLRKILKFLQELSHSCGLGRYPEKSSSVDDVNGGATDSEIKEKIVLNGDPYCLMLDGHWLADTTSDDSVITTANGTDGNGVLQAGDALLSWIFSGPSSGDRVTLWLSSKEEKTQQGIEILQTLEKEYYHLQGFCERKGDHLSYEEALQSVEDLCLEEGKKRETVTEFAHQSYEAVLKRRREELIENETDVAFLTSRFELEAISNVLKEAESLNVNQFGYEDTYVGMTSQLCDLESGEDDWRTRDYFHQVDSCIEIAIQRQKEQLSLELSKIDARIMRNVNRMQQLELKLEPVSAYDYRSILLPLVKSYLRAHLEDLAEKDATEKSDAAREAFLAELALDSKKDVRGGNDNAKHGLEKSKDKKKNRDHRKFKDSKAVIGNGLHMLTNESIEEDSFPVTYDVDKLESEVVLARSEDSKQHEEELRRQIELEAEERKLEETLEYQRKIENEAKLKHLAEQNKKSNDSSAEQVPEMSHEYTVPSAGHIGSQEDLTLKNRFLNHFDSTEMDDINSTAPSKSVDLSDTQRMNGTHVKVKQEIPNGRLPVDPLPSERRSGRRSRRQKSSTKSLDGKYEAAQSSCNADENGLLPDGGHVESVDPLLAESGGKTLRQLKAEEDDEERFQADLKQAVRQSMDMYQAHQKIPLLPNVRTAQRVPSEANNTRVSPDEAPSDGVSEINVFGTGLQNETGEYNCFLNVIIQSLWHLRQFRERFLNKSASDHIHVGVPCVVCALYDIFSALNAATSDTRKEPVAPTLLRIALSNLYPDSNFFQEAQMNDASEVLAVIFDCLHRSFTPGSSVSDAESVDNNCMGSWDCANSTCLVHSLFGMDISERMNCYSCGLESRHMKYTSFFHNINASALQTMKVMYAESSFDELLNFVEVNHQLACDPDAGGCGKFNYIHHILSTPPPVFTTVIGWQKTCESADDIAATLGALNTEIDISILYRGLGPKNKHRLVSVVCYYGQHYHCFAYSHDHGRWIMYDDKTVKEVGSWSDVIVMCERGHLQPQVLFFEAAN